jgi:dCMP deaminase
MRGDWLDYLMEIARVAARKSKDTTKVGAVLVGPHKEVLLTAYNGLPMGVADLPERMERPIKYMYTSHAETNLVAFAARNGIRTEGKSVVTTHYPCSSCARVLIQAGIVCAHEMFTEADVVLVRH